jgi:hypothetical protein
MVSCRIGITRNAYEVESILSQDWGGIPYMESILLYDYNKIKDIDMLIEMGNIENLEPASEDILHIKPRAKNQSVVHDINNFPIYDYYKYEYLFVTQDYITMDITNQFTIQGWYVRDVSLEENFVLLNRYVD